MKKHYALSLLLILSANNLFSQSGWFWQNPLPQGNDLNTIEITTDGTLFAGGFSGTIIKSSNRAASWEVLNNVQQYNGWFHKISFIDNNTGWSVGQDWGLYYTTNKGNTWTLRYLNNSIILYDLFIKNQDTSWACGTTSTIVKTTNNWETWSTQLFNQNGAYHLKSIAFFDMNTGYCVGSPGSFPNGSIMYHTTNSGTNWNLESAPVSSSLEYVGYLTNSIIIIATGNGEILRSTNSGADWMVIQLSPIHRFKEVHFINLQTGWVVGASGVIFKTTNSGIDWFPQVSNTNKNLSSVKFSDMNTGYAVGDDGSILKTTNGGINWNNKTSYLLNNENNIIQVIKFLNINTGYLFGYAGLIAKSTDGGTSWTEQKSNTTNNLMRACFLDDDNIWAAGYNGTLLKTINGGGNWSVIPFPNTSRITGIHFPNNNTGYVSTQSTERVLKTTNGGLNWFSPIISQQIQYGNNIFFINSQTGFIVSNSGLINKTENGGFFWMPYYHTLSRDFSDIFFINSNTGWVCGDGGIILKTTNTGVQWIQQNMLGQPLLKIMFVDEDNGWAAGLYGYLLKTTNGGQNWYRVLSGTDHWLQDIFFINQTTGWIVGGNDVLKTTNGGVVVSMNIEENSVPLNYSLHQNYPNPFNPVTRIKFDLPKQSNAKVIIYDLLGREITTLVNEQLNSGSYAVEWDGSSYASGVYFYALIAEDPSTTLRVTETKRMVLIK